MKSEYIQGYWMQKSGHLIRIVEMQDKYLINCYEMLKRVDKGIVFKKYLLEIEREVKDRGLVVCNECGSYTRNLYDGMCQGCFEDIYENEFVEVREAW